LLDSLLAPKYTLQKSQCRKQPVSRPSLPTKSPAYWRHRRYRIATAQGLVECGATVFLSSPRETKINKCIQSILSNHPFAKGRVFGYPCDLSSQQVETNLEQLFEKVGTVNYTVFMAGERLPDSTSGRDQFGKDAEDLPQPHIRRDAQSQNRRAICYERSLIVHHTHHG
jgi:hypothetical protein